MSTDVGIPPGETVDEYDGSNLYATCEQCGVAHIIRDDGVGTLTHTNEPSILAIYDALQIDHAEYLFHMAPFYHGLASDDTCGLFSTPCDHSIETEIIGQEINTQLHRMGNGQMVWQSLSDTAQSLLNRLEDHTLSAHPWSLTCTCDLSQWASETAAYEDEYADAMGLVVTHATRPQWRAALAELVYTRIAFFDPLPGAPDRGRMQWNMAFDEWLPARGDYHPPSPDFLRAFTPALDAQALSRMVKRLITSGKLAAHVGRRLPMQEWMAVRDLVFERDDYTCVFCGTRGGKLHCDHLIPLSRGGSNDPENLATACDVCNLSKHAKTPEEWLR